MDNSLKFGKEDILTEPEENANRCGITIHPLLLNDLWFKKPDGKYSRFISEHQSMTTRDYADMMFDISSKMIKALVPQIHNNPNVNIDDLIFNYKREVDTEWDTKYGIDVEGDLKESPILVTVNQEG